VLVLAVLVAMLDTGESAERSAELEIAVQPSRFFAGDATRRPTADELALQVLLAQIERHVRLEQAAAESFLEMPSPESLGSPTDSPLAN